MKRIISVFVCVFLCPFFLDAQDLFLEDNNRFHLKTHYLSNGEKNYIGGTIIATPSKDGFSLLGLLSYTGERVQKKDYAGAKWIQPAFGFIYRGKSTTNLRYRSYGSILYWLNSDAESDGYGIASSGGALDVFYPWEENTFEAAVFASGRIENHYNFEGKVERENNVFAKVGVQTLFPLEDETFWAGGRATLLYGFSSFDSRGIFPYQDVPEMILLGGILRHIRIKETIHVEANVATFFQTIKYWDLKGSWKYNKLGIYLHYIHNETQYPDYPLIHDFWNVGVTFNM